MRKLNVKNLLILMLGMLMFIVCITEWIVAVIYGGTFTIAGLIINFGELYISSLCYEYLNAYLKEKKKNKK